MLVYIAGIPGVGKTTIIKKLVDKLNSLNHKSEHIKGLPILCKLAGNISSEEFRRLPDGVRRQYRPMMYKIIYSIDRNDFKTIRILDGHFAYFEANVKKYSIRPINKADRKQLKVIFVIVSRSDEILKRRKIDVKERADRIFDLEYISEQELIERKVAIRQASALKIPLFFISNSSKIGDATDEIYQKLEKLSIV